MIKLPHIKDARDLRGKRVLVRLDLNVGVMDGHVVESFKIDNILPTIDILHFAGARVILFSHITEGKGYDSLYPMWQYLNKLLPVKFSPTYFTQEANAMVAELTDGEVVLFENIRMNPGENANDMEFAKKLASYGDVYVNDAFGESHRHQASITLLPTLLPHYAGPLFIQEVENLSKAFLPEHPFLFILGGAKFDTKLPLIKKFLDIADTVFVGGALANNIFVTQGYEIGSTSLVAPGDFGITDMLQNSKFKYPVDVKVRSSDGLELDKKMNDVISTDYIADCGPQTMNELKKLIGTAQYILWNGPLGNFEIGFCQSTLYLAELIAESGTHSIIGGGDTLSAIEPLDILDKFSFVSTGGGAMLDFLANETLPGIEALMGKAS